MPIKFLTGEPALLYNKNLVIAELHLGIETEYRRAGIYVPSQTAKMVEKLDSLIKQTKPKRLVFLGDIKHQVPGVSMQELNEIPEFFSHFSSKIETHVCLGNHDSEIPALVENVKIHGTDGFRLEDAYLSHGHSWPKKEFLKCKYLIVSHTHPLFEIKDKIGYRFAERAWIKAKFDEKNLPFLFQKKGYSTQRKGFREVRLLKTKNLPEIILMPAFNDFAGGVALNTKLENRIRNKEAFFGPLTKLVDKKETEVFLLDGTYLGKLEKLKK